MNKKGHIKFREEPLHQNPTYSHSSTLNSLSISASRRDPPHAVTHTPLRDHKQHWRRVKPRPYLPGTWATPQGERALSPRKNLPPRGTEDPNLARSRYTTY